jgi:transitional endoplasmic reticulum ATPase
VIIGITSSLELVDEVWLTGCRFSKIHHVTVSKPEQRKEILGMLLEGACTEQVVDEVVMQTHGFTVADLVALKTAAVMRAVECEEGLKRIEEEGRLLLEDLQAALKLVRPSLMANYYQPSPKQRMDDLVGLDPTIRRLRELILTPLQSPELCRKYRLGLPKGILIHGPPGTGKTHLVMGLVREAGLNYIPVRACSIRSKYVGQSEKNLAAVFQKARECAPSILVLDQLDGLVTRRSAEASTSDNSANRLITCFLTEMDGLLTKDRENGVIVIGITDSIDALDEAMIRPGRLGIHLELPAELSLADRQAFFSKTPIRHGLTEAQVLEIARRTEGYTGAKLDWLMREAAMKALDEGIVGFHHFEHLTNPSVL